MSPDSRQTSQRQELYSKASSVSTQLEQVTGDLKKAIRHEGFALLRKGVSAMVNSVEAWAERSVL